MKKTVWTFGLISGAISVVMMFGTLPYADRIGFDKSEVIGYTTMVLSFLMVFFGIRSYRDNVDGGAITFGKALSIGLLITLISCVCYVASWEILYFNFMPDFLDKYAAHMVEQAKSSGASDSAILAQIQAIQKMKERYNNPIYNVAITFIEPLPVGLIITFLSAAILRRKRQVGEMMPSTS
jgi:hypothetical protein